MRGADDLGEKGYCLASNSLPQLPLKGVLKVQRVKIVVSSEECRMRNCSFLVFKDFGRKGIEEPYFEFQNKNNSFIFELLFH